MSTNKQHHHHALAVHDSYDQYKPARIPSGSARACVYEATAAWGEREKGGLVLRDTTVTWLSDLFRRDSSRGGKFSRDSSCGPLLYAVLEPS